MSSNVRVLSGLIAAQVCLHTSLSGLRMAAPLYVLHSALGEWAVGPLLALFGVAPLLCALPAGRLADRRGYHLPARIAAVCSVMGGLCALLATLPGWPRYLLLCLAAPLAGAGGNIGLITIQRTAGRNAGSATELKRVFSWLGIAPSFSNFAGPLAAGLLIDWVSYRAAFLVLSLLPVVSVAFARLVPQDAAPAPPAEGPRPAAWELFSIPTLPRLLLINWFMSTGWDVHSFVVPVLGHERGMSASAIGMVLGVFAVAVTSVRLIIPLLAHRLSERQVLTYAMLWVGCVLLIYPLASSPLSMAACAVLLGVALGSSQPMVMTSLHQITPPQRHGEVIALRTLVIGLSGTLMPLGFGVLGAALGASSLFWMMGLLMGAGSLLPRGLGHAPETPAA
jgi:MFS family permease